MASMALIHLSFGIVTVTGAVAFGWLLRLERTVAEAELSALERERASLQLEIAQKERSLEELSFDANMNAMDEHERAKWMVERQRTELLDAYRQRMSLPDKYPNNPLALAQEKRQLDVLIDCFPYGLRKIVEDDLGLKLDCDCPPGDPLCSCL